MGRDGEEVLRARGNGAWEEERGGKAIPLGEEGGADAEFGVGTCKR